MAGKTMARYPSLAGLKLGTDDIDCKRSGDDVESCPFRNRLFERSG